MGRGPQPTPRHEDGGKGPSELEATKPFPGKERPASAQGTKREFREERISDPETGVVPAETGTAICVQEVDVQCVLQFTLIHAAGCALHRHTSRVIHRLELFFRDPRVAHKVRTPGRGNIPAGARGLPAAERLPGGLPNG